MVYKSSKETQERKDLKKKHIIETAIKVFSINGYHGTTVKDVVEAADISVGTFYFYFKNKEDLFDTLYDDVSEEFFNALINSLDNINKEIDLGFSKAIAFFLKVIELNKPLARILLIEAVGLNPRFEKRRYEITQKYVSYTSNYFEQMKQTGDLKTPDVKICSLAFIGTLYNVIMEWLQSDAPTSLTNYAYALTIYNLQALGITYEDENVKQGIEDVLKNISFNC
ncbi:TetR/AcrR family transcriptional regulator [Clostridium folliculivorans]|uniref:Transcriptional regulator n=1 Tax=Clostridium folliculivorans TaxID=2886038 RepID=A0A9W5Y4E6_9CLOT|nr:TetR/AcrR family transcriptional regulator [Clostridium folliculivorans]GKU26318.1 transcriptional regulator [Clostridium folliculivorans]GKU32127.1 transcriptional regulator [Clostridium folliculivorans]